jgi:hypothetical protein
MTAKISQQVVRRPGTKSSFASQFTQRGSVNHATITVVFSFMALIVVSLLGFFYLQQVIDTASQGADIHTLQAQIGSLKEQQRDLELQGAEVRSLQNVQDRVQKLNLVQSNHVTYLSSQAGQVALAQ